MVKPSDHWSRLTFARSMGVRWTSLRASGEAPTRSNISTVSTSAAPFTAQCNGVSPISFVACTFAPSWKDRIILIGWKDSFCGYSVYCDNYEFMKLILNDRKDVEEIYAYIFLCSPSVQKFAIIFIFHIINSWMEIDDFRTIHHSYNSLQKQNLSIPRRERWRLARNRRRWPNAVDCRLRSPSPISSHSHYWPGSESAGNNFISVSVKTALISLTITYPRRAHICNAVSFVPTTTASTSAPKSIKYSTIASLPQSAAVCNAFLPWQPTSFMSNGAGSSCKRLVWNDSTRNFKEMIPQFLCSFHTDKVDGIWSTSTCYSRLSSNVSPANNNSS